MQELYSGKSDRAKDLAMEVNNLTCKVCGGFQEGCTCDPDPEPMEELKPVPAREMLHQAHIDLQVVLLSLGPVEDAMQRDHDRLVKAAAAIKLLWEANRGY